MDSLVEWKDKPVKYLRDRIIDQLKYNLSKDHLEMQEFEQMVNIALTTQSKSELLSLVADLPTKGGNEIKKPETGIEITGNRDSITCIMSEIKRNGNWLQSRDLKILTVMGASEIDFSEVSFNSDVVYVSVNCWFGEVKIIVPPGVNVVVNVKGIAAGIENESRKSIDPNLPTIILEGKVLFGALVVK